MKNVTVALEEEVARWVRVRAAEQNQSVSRYLNAPVFVDTNVWDSLIAAAARLAECRFLLTEDLQHDQDLNGVRVLNPFIARPSSSS